MADGLASRLGSGDGTAAANRRSLHRGFSPAARARARRFCPACASVMRSGSCRTSTGISRPCCDEVGSLALGRRGDRFDPRRLQEAGSEDLPGGARRPGRLRGGCGLRGRLVPARHDRSARDGDAARLAPRRRRGRQRRTLLPAGSRDPEAFAAAGAFAVKRKTAETPLLLRRLPRSRTFAGARGRRRRDPEGHGPAARGEGRVSRGLPHARGARRPRARAAGPRFRDVRGLRGAREPGAVGEPRASASSTARGRSPTRIGKE